MYNNYEIFNLFHIVFFTTEVSKSQELLIRVYNKTGHNVKLLRLNNVLIGDIKKDSSILVSNWKKLELQGNKPFGRLKGYIQGFQEDKIDHFLCGTGVRTVNKGNYEFDLGIQSSPLGYNLFLLAHLMCQPLTAAKAQWLPRTKFNFFYLKYFY